MTAKKPPSSPSQKELEEYLGHYSYEVGMLSAAFKAHNILMGIKEFEPNSNLIEILRITTLESFLVHCRCLSEFFHADEMDRAKHTDKKTKKFDLSKVTSDYVAQHYVSNWEDIRKKIQTKRNISKDRFHEISRQLSHLSRSRVSGFAYPHVDMNHDFLLLHEEFVKNLPEKLKKKLLKQ